MQNHGLTLRKLYPSGEFPDIARDAINEATSNINAPSGLIAGSALAALSLACQSILDVELPTGSVVPCSLFIITIAESGERKTTADNRMGEAIRNHERASLAVNTSKAREYETDLKIWKNIESAISKQLRKDVGNNQPTEEVEGRLREHIEKMPLPPTRKMIIFNDPTPQAMVKQLGSNGVSAGLITDEGGILTSSRAMGHTALLNKLWDGGQIQQSRLSTGDTVVSDARLTVSIMVQPKTFDRFLSSREDILRDNGFLARSLICFPKSTQGNRFSSDVTPSWEKNKLFQTLIAKILDKSDQRTSAGGTRDTSKLTHDAKQLWHRRYNYLESELSPLGNFCDVKDFASKYCEISTRIAAIFQYVIDQSTEIEEGAMHRAFIVCDWYLDEFKLLFGKQAELPQHEVDAEVLYDWLRINRWNAFISGQLTPRDISQFGPYSLRTRARRDAALRDLQWRSIVQLEKIFKTEYIKPGKNYTGGPLNSAEPLRNQPWPLQKSWKDQYK